MKELTIPSSVTFIDRYISGNSINLERFIVEEGNKKYFRGYCVDLLSNLHKEKYNDVREALSKKRW